MKYQNVILISIFVFGIVIFYLASCQISNGKNVAAVVEEKTREEIEYYNVELRGEFIRTGTFLIPSDWTVEMLFEYGGLKSVGDVSGFKLTDLIEDKKQYFVPKKGIQSSENNLININTASISELASLHGIGEVLASNIIEYRDKYPFTSVEDIKNVKGIGDYIYEKIKDLITV